MKDQCSDYSAPCSIQRRSRSICAGRELLAGLGRRHSLVGVLGGDALNELALFGFAGHDGEVAAEIGERTVLGVEPQMRLALLRVRAVALEAASDRIGRMSRWKLMGASAVDRLVNVAREKITNSTGRAPFVILNLVRSL